MQGFNREKLGTETLKLLDGSELTIDIHAVSNYEMMKLRRKFRKTQIDSNGRIKSVEFEDEDFIIEVLDISTGIKVSKDQLKAVTSDLKEIYDKYFTLDKEKKSKSTDIAEQNQVKESQE